jgi:hypothetical protein
MSLLTICQNAAVELKWLPPVQVFGNTAEEAATLLRLAQRIGRDALERGIWPARRATHTFSAVAGSVQAGALPGDFGRQVPESLWRRDVPTLLLGPLTGADWAAVTALQTPSCTPRWWTRDSGGVRLWPAASGGEQVALEYFSNAFCTSSGGTPQAQWQADTDVGLISEELITLGIIAFALRNEGQPYQPQMGDYERLLARLNRQEQPATMLRSEASMMRRPREAISL